MREGPSLTQAAVYAELVRVQRQEERPRASVRGMFKKRNGHKASPTEKPFLRRNGVVSRAHRLEAGLITGVPSVEGVRMAMANMAKIAANCQDDHIRAQAVKVYDECWHMLRSIELGLPVEAQPKPKAPEQMGGDTPSARQHH